MTIFRYKKDGELYLIYEVFRSFKMTWKRYQAVPYKGGSDWYYLDGFEVRNLDDFEVVAYR